MTEKPFELGMVLGRFQPLHAGHVQLIDTALSLCRRVCVLVGSAQESGTLKNPLSYELRRELLLAVYGDAVEVYPLADAGLGNVAAWGDYVLSNFAEYTGRHPDLIVSSRETRRTDWFANSGELPIYELTVPRLIDVSATDMRACFAADDRETWQSFTDPRLWPYYDRLRTVALAATATDTQSI